MSTADGGKGKAILFGLLALVGLIAAAIVWSSPRSLHEQGGVARAGDVSASGMAEANPSSDVGRAEGKRQSAAPASQPANVEVEEARPISAEVRFMDEHGVPIAGVELRVAEDSSVGISGSDGVARLGLGPLARSGRLLAFDARCQGYARDRRRATVQAGSDLLLGDWLLLPGGNVEGTVVDEGGRGLAGVEVAVLDEDLKEQDWERERRGALGSLWRPAARSVTEMDGSFMLEEARAGRIRLVAVTEDRPAGRSGLVDVPAGGVARGVEIRMEAADGGTTIAGIVLDPDEAPVPYASVTVAGRSSSYSMSADEEGRFQVRLDDREPREVTAMDPERRHREATLQGVRSGTRDLVLRLTPAPEIELAVESREGAPIERFAVATIAERDAEVLVFRPEAERPGGLVVLGAPGQSFFVEVRANGWMPARLGPFPAETPPARLECKLDPAGGVRGIVVASGQPVAGATVALYEPVKEDDTHNGFPLRTKTAPAIETESEEHGTFSLSVDEAGAYYLRAEADGHASAELGPLELSPASQHEARIELGSGGTLEARVRSSAGASVAGTLVAISRGDGRARTERTDERGVVVFPRLTPGRWQVEISKEEIHPDYGPTRFGTKPAREVPSNCRVFEGETTRVDLWLEGEDEKACVLTGRLVIDGEPAEGWLASLDREGSAAGEPRPFDEPGTFRLAVREPGSYRLGLRPDTADPGAMLAIFDPVELYQGTSYWSLELETGKLEGKLAASGENELVFYRWVRGALECYVPLVPGEDGRFRCERVPAGRGALVRANPEPPLDEQTPAVLRELAVEAGKTLALDL